MLATFAGCDVTKQNNNETQNQSETSASVLESDATDLASETSSKGYLTQIIKPGDAWLVHNHNNGDDHTKDYITIFRDNKDGVYIGSRLRLDSASGLAFGCYILKEYKGYAKATFNIGDISLWADADIKIVNDGYWVVHMRRNDDPHNYDPIETFEDYHFIKNIGSNSFYGTMDLQEWATQYYESENDDNHGEPIVINEENGVDVTIKIPQYYDDKKILATYKVNRFTSQLSVEGKDLETEVFLNQFDDKATSRYK